MTNKLLVSMLSHRPFKYTKPTWDILKSLAERYPVDVIVNFQDKDFYDDVPEEYREHIELQYNKAHNQGENRIFARLNWKNYEYVSLIDDDIMRLS